MKWQTPSNEIIEGVTLQGAILALREKNQQQDKYFDFVYDWEEHADGIHLMQKKANKG